MIGLIDDARMNQHRPFLTTRAARLLVAPAILAAGVVASPTTSAAHVPVTCGAVVPSDVRLRADLLDCPGSGLVIGAPDVTIDLAGHVIDGTGSGTGIDNSAGHDDVRIRRGTVREFLFGLHLFETSGAQIDRVAAHSNTNGVIIERSDAVVLDGVTATGNVATGIEVTFSDGIAVRRSTAADNGHSGIVDRASYDTRYQRNTITGNVAPGLDVWFSDGVVVERNHVAANDSAGVQLIGVEGAVIERNATVANAEHGISIDRPGSTVTRNHSFDNQGIGIAAPDGTIDGGRNHASGNLGGDCTGVVCT